MDTAGSAAPHQTGSDSASRYWAFISYSHRDRAWGEWLHRSIESYRAPKALAAKGPDRLYPVFRDRDELAGAPRLTDAIRAALRESRSLVVICSPNSAQSRWVDEEIRYFKELGRADRIFALIVDGDPSAAPEKGGCFPAELYRPGENGEASADLVACDARKLGDGKRNALLKLIAGLLSVPYDSLRQREQERQLRRRTAWTAALLASTAVLAALALYANAKRKDAVASATVAVSRQLSTQALNHMNDQLDLALLLAVESDRVAPTLEARTALVKTLQTARGLVAFRRAHSGAVTALAVSPDGKTIASGGADAAVRLWTIGGAPFSSEPAYKHTKIADSNDEIRSLVFSGDSRRLASGSLQASLQLYDVESRRPLVKEMEMGGTVETLAFAPDGRRIEADTGGPSGLASLDLQSFEFLKPSWAIQCPCDGAYSPDGRLLAATGEGPEFKKGLYLLDADTRQPLGAALADNSVADRLLFSPSGALLAAGQTDGSVRVWNTQTRKELGYPIVGDGPVLALQFSADEKQLRWARSDGLIRTWNLDGWTAAGSPIAVGQITSMAFAPDGKTIVLGGADGSMRIWETRDTRHALGTAVSTDPANPHLVTFSPDGNILAVGGTDGVALFDPVTFARKGGVGGRIYDAAFLSGKTLLASGEGDVYTLDTATSKYQIVFDGRPAGLISLVLVAVAPDKHTIALSDSKGVMLWDLESGGPFARIPPNTWCGKGVFSPDGKTLIVAEQTRVHFIDLAARGEKRKALDFGSYVWGLRFDAAGRTLAIGGENGRLQLYDYPAMNPAGAPWPGFQDKVVSLAFSPDGALMAAGDTRRNLVVFDLATRQPLGGAYFSPAEYDGVASLDFSPDSKRLAAAMEYRFYVFDVGIESWKARACRIAERNLSQEEWRRYLGDEPYRVTCPNVSGKLNRPTSPTSKRR